MSKAVRVQDLTDLMGTSYPRLVLHCTGRCGQDYSADGGDYFLSNPDRVFRCCRRNMVLATKRVVYVEMGS